MTGPDDILAFWFGRDPDDAAVAQQFSPLWWEKNPETDAAIRTRFAALTTAAASGRLEAADRKALFEDYTDYAARHQAIITQFGRFPHRNAILGRTSTTEETTFLQQPGSSF